MRSVRDKPHCTLAVIDPAALNVKVQVRVFCPPLEQAPDQITSRPLLALMVIEVPVVNGADCVPGTATLIPLGLDSTRSPLRPLAVTVSVAVPPGGGGGGGGAVPCGAKLRTTENGPAVPAELTPRTRHQ